MAKHMEDVTEGNLLYENGVKDIITPVMFLTGSMISKQ
jgi:hypothetical protein